MERRILTIAIWFSACAFAPTVPGFGEQTPIRLRAGVQLPEISIVEATCCGFVPLERSYVANKFRVSHVYYGLSAKVDDVIYITSDRRGPGFSGDLLWPIPKTDQKGLFKVKLHDGRLMRVLGPSIPWFANVVEGEGRYSEYKTLATIVESFERIPKNQRVQGLRKYADSSTDEVAEWAIFVFAHEFPDEFIRAAHRMIEKDASRIRQDISLDSEMERLDRDAWESSLLRAKMFAAFGTSHPSECEASALLSYLRVQIETMTQVPASKEAKALFVRTAVAVALNPNMPVNDRSSVCAALGGAAVKKSVPGAIEALRSVEANADESKVRAEAKAWLTKVLAD